MKNTLLILVPCLTLACLGLASCSDPDAEGCGNDILDVGESCDGQDFGGNTCGDISGLGKYAGGFLGCNNDCTLDFSKCDLNYGYPEEPNSGFGKEVGDIIEDLSFDLGNEVAKKFAERNDEDKVLSLNHIYREGINKGGKWKGILLFFTTGWCPPCQIEGEILADVAYQFEQEGILFVGVTLEDRNYAPATGAYAQEHSDTYGWTFPTVAGVTAALQNYWPGGSVAFPLNMLVDLDDMKIHSVETGALVNASAVQQFLQPVLGTE